MKYLYFFLIAVLISSCINVKKSPITLPVGHYAEDDVPNFFESSEMTTEEENGGTADQYVFEFSRDTYLHMNDLSYFLADTSVKSLRFWGGTFSNLSPLAELSDLEELIILGNRYITDISPIRSLVNLKRLTLINGRNMENIDVLSSLVNLEYLELDHKDKYYKEFLSLQRLEVLKIRNEFPHELDVSYIAQLHSLKELEIYLDSLNLVNIGELKTLVNLERLTVNYGGNLDISWLPHLQKLKELELRRSTIDNVSPLLELPNLTEVNLHYSKIRDITPLLESRSIKRINGPIVENDIGLYHLFKERGIEYYPHISDR